MKSLFIVSERKVNHHIGEEYDVIIEVEDQPTTETIQSWALRIRGTIRSLWQEQTGEKEPKVLVKVDAAGPFFAMITNFQVIMLAEEKTVIEIDGYDKSQKSIDDPEAKELLRRLDGR